MGEDQELPKTVIVGYCLYGCGTWDAWGANSVYRKMPYFGSLFGCDINHHLHRLGKLVMNKADTLIYIATPFSHDDEKVMVQRFDAVTLFCGKMIKEGHHVYSPITHTYPMAKVMDLRTDWEFWKENCTLYLSRCDKLIVLMLDGWRDSFGVGAEIDIASELGLEIEYVKVNN